MFQNSDSVSGHVWDMISRGIRQLELCISAILCRTSSRETKVRQATKGVLRELNKSERLCICRRHPVVAKTLQELLAEGNIGAGGCSNVGGGSGGGGVVVVVPLVLVIVVVAVMEVVAKILVVAVMEVILLVVVVVVKNDGGTNVGGDVDGDNGDSRW
ncbi:hypothetical protein JHK86_016859 [Glycine max]|nr:hypothetical protein JHK86_016859 [Glycine max]